MAVICLNSLEVAGYNQRQYEREISLEQVLTDPDAQTRDTLVLEITAFGRVRVYRE